MSTDGFPRPPIDREEIARVRARLRQQIRDAPPSDDPIVREMQQAIAQGAGGRDLLAIEAYREHFAAHADELTGQLRRGREELDEQNRGRSDDE